ncbi:unnamed protein product, partial [Oppiella nova]
MVLDHNLDLVKEWVRVIFADKTAAKYAAGTATHWYSPGTPHTVLDEAYQGHPDKFFLATEACQVGGVKIGDWHLAERYANDIIQHLLHHTMGWVDWNMALDTQGGPNWTNNFVDSPILINAGAGEYYRQPSYYALAHFSKFLPPGSVRVDTTSTGSKASVAAFRRPDNSVAVIVVNNDNTDI